MSCFPCAKDNCRRFLAAVVRPFTIFNSEKKETVMKEPYPQSSISQSKNLPDASDKLAVEHMLCSSCQAAIDASQYLQNPSLNLENSRRSITDDFRHYANLEALESSATGGCHLCSLILGRIRDRGAVIAGPVDVALRVTRSSSMSFIVQVGESRDLSLGELVIVPSGYSEDTEQNSPVFSFSDSSVFERAQRAKSLGAHESFVLAKEWLQQCSQNHDRCRAAAEAATPTTRPKRLVDVGLDDGMECRIIMTEDLGAMGWEYLTLSHCWGGADILKLLVENEEELKVRTSLDALPTTFQHAIIITRHLGFRYVWIDSLCILQNSASEWRSEAMIMGDIYAHSVCSIAALTARNSFEGCFFDHTRIPLSARPCRLTDGLRVEGIAAVGVDLRKGLEPLPLHTRAWVVQERILAPRTLYYGATGLAWECVQCSATEGLPCGAVSRFSPKASFFNVLQRPAEEVYNHWLDVQIAYSRCALTKFDDRLIAISSVVKRIEDVTGWTSTWGMWKEKMLMDMLWFVEEPSKRPETKEYLAPTWSWAGVEGRAMQAVSEQEHPEWTAEVAEVGSKDERGFVRLRAIRRRVTRTGTTRLNPGADTLAPKWLEVDWSPDVEPASEDLRQEVWCVLVCRLPNYLGDMASDIGLVLKQKGDIWIRLGVFKQLREEHPLFPENLTDYEEIAIF